jgi:cytochrome c oxidase subunit IV
MSHHVAKPRFYVLIWFILICLTVLTAGVAKIDLGAANAPIAMVIAGTKATLVALFFMHMRWNDNPTRVAGVAALFWLAIMFFLTLADFFTRYGLVYPNQ